MKTATQILKENGIEYSNFISMADHNSVIEAMIQYAKQCCKATLDKASKNALLKINTGRPPKIDKSSIINPENIVLL